MQGKARQGKAGRDTLGTCRCTHEKSMELNLGVGNNKNKSSSDSGDSNDSSDSSDSSSKLVTVVVMAVITVVVVWDVGRVFVGCSVSMGRM